MEINRINTALEFLKEGQSFKIENLRLTPSNSQLIVTGWTQFSRLENLTKNLALQELNRIKSTLKEIENSSDDFKRMILDKSVKYNLAYDYGTGGIGICSETDGIIKWETEIQD